MVKYCKFCGNLLKEEAKFCNKCGAQIEEESISIDSNTIECIHTEKTDIHEDIIDNNQFKKYLMVNGILEIVFGSLLLLIGISDISYDWGLVSLAIGLSLLVIGILTLLKKHIWLLKIIFGGVTIFLGLICNLNCDWAYISILAGACMLSTGILSKMNKSIKVIGIIQIVIAALLLIIGMADMDVDWGLISACAGISFLVPGILHLVNLNK